MPAFKVLAVEPKVSEFSNDFGTFDVDRLTLQDGESPPVTCEQSRKRDGNVASYGVGDTAEGDIQASANSQFLPKFKRSYSGGGGRGGGPRPPEEVAGMRRSASLATATRNLSPLSAAPTNDEIKARLDLLRRMADWLDGDVKQQADAAKGSNSQPPPAGSNPVLEGDLPPPDEGGMGNEKEGDDIPF